MMEMFYITSSAIIATWKMASMTEELIFLILINLNVGSHIYDWVVTT